MIHKLRLILIYGVTTILYGYAIVLFSSLSNFDTDSYTKIGTLTLSGTNVYPDPAISRHPYLPFILYLEAVAVRLSSAVNFPASTLLKIFFSLFHLFSIYSIYRLSKQNIKITLFYAINPISLLIITFHGQFDIIPLSLLLYGILLMRQKKYIQTALILSCAVTIKTWPILFIAPYLRRVPYKYYPVLLLAPIAAIVVYMYFFNASLWSIIRVLVVYQGVQGVWGIGALLSFLSVPKVGAILVKIAFLIILTTIAIRQKKSTLIEEIATLLLVFFILTPGFGIQWFIWLVPFLFLSRKPFIGMLYFPIMLTILVSYATWIEMFGLNTYLGNTVLYVLYPLFGILFTIQKMVPQTSRL